MKKPWGWYDKISKNEKMLYILPTSMTSLQTHKGRSECWVIISGNCVVTVNDKNTRKQPNDMVVIPKGVPHRIRALGNMVVVYEKWSGKYNESDITRLEDIYQR